MDDLISRQAAIDAIKGLPTWWADDGGYYGGAQQPMEALLEPNDVISAIDNLPSARSADAVEVVRCKECVENDAQGWCWKFGYTMHDGDFCSFGERKTDG